MFPGAIEISQRLAQVAEDQVPLYFSALRFHYALWKWQHISEHGSLCFLRRTLAEHGLVEANPAASWIVNRGAAEYKDVLGSDLIAQRLARLQREGLKGHVSRRQPKSAYDSGSGNGTACYELTMPGLVYAGSGLSLLYSVDGTLRSWLREPFQGARLKAYRSGLAAHAFKTAEIWSVAHFTSPTPFEFDPIAELNTACADGVVTSGTLNTLVERTDEALSKYRQQNADGQAMVTGIALGYLLDAMAGRVRVPNGMQFSFADSLEWARPLGEVFVAVERQPIRTEAILRLMESASQCEELAGVIARHLEDTSLQPDPSAVVGLPMLADCFKAAAFDLRGRSGAEDLIESLHFIGNELWCWHFFLSDLDSWNATEKSSRCAYDHVATVRAWLERPWGILRPEDMQLALAEGFEPTDELPRLSSPLMPLLRGGVDQLIRQNFGALPRASDRLEQFIAHRCQLLDARMALEWISYEDQGPDLAQATKLADLLVQMVTLWFYAQPQQTRQEIARQGLLPLAEMLQSSTWLDRVSLPQLSRRQLSLLDEYRGNPKATADALFEFKPGMDLVDRLDVYPSERFWIVPQQ